MCANPLASTCVRSQLKRKKNLCRRFTYAATTLAALTATMFTSSVQDSRTPRIAWWKQQQFVNCVRRLLRRVINTLSKLFFEKSAIYTYIPVKRIANNANSYSIFSQKCWQPLQPYVAKGHKVTTCGHRHGWRNCQGGACDSIILHPLFVYIFSDISMVLEPYAAEVHREWHRTAE